MMWDHYFPALKQRPRVEAVLFSPLMVYWRLAELGPRTAISLAYAVSFRQVLKSLNPPFVCAFAQRITGSAARLMIHLPAAHQKSAWSPPIVAQRKTETDCLGICQTRCSSRPPGSGNWKRVGPGTHLPGPASRWSSFVYGTWPPRWHIQAAFFALEYHALPVGSPFAQVRAIHFQSPMQWFERSEKSL